MPALLELASEVNGFVTFRQVMAVGIPRRDYPRPRASPLWDTRGFLGARGWAPCAIEALAQVSFSKKHVKSVSNFRNCE